MKPPILKEQSEKKTEIQEQKEDSVVNFDINKFMDQFMKAHEKTLAKLAKI